MTTPPMSGDTRGVEPCPLCDDSGYQEFVSGGIWTGENITARREFCDCACGQDARDQIAGVGFRTTPTSNIKDNPDD